MRTTAGCCECDELDTADTTSAAGVQQQQGCCAGCSACCSLHCLQWLHVASAAAGSAASRGLLQSALLHNNENLWTVHNACCCYAQTSLSSCIRRDQNGKPVSEKLSPVALLAKLTVPAKGMEQLLREDLHELANLWDDGPDDGLYFYL